MIKSYDKTYVSQTWIISCFADDGSSAHSVVPREPFLRTTARRCIVANAGRSKLDDAMLYAEMDGPL